MRITEKKRIKIYNGCTNNPFYISWLNSKGSWNYWLFTRKQTYNIDVKGGDTFETYITNLETAETVIDTFDKSAAQSVVVGADNLSINDINGLKGMLHSVKVQWLTNPETWQADGCKWLTVLVKDGTWKIYETDKNKSSIEFEILLPQINQQTQ